jgi:hypothetical protein
MIMETNTVCEVQELNLRLIELASFNSFNGEQHANLRMADWGRRILLAAATRETESDT